jgi:uncharacterized protein (TIGR02453 family)
MTRRIFQGFPKESIQFLRSLARHNNRQWFQDHKTVYETSLKKPLVDLIAALAAEFGRFAPEMVATAKTSTYRIYRDIRFSRDKSPYKTHVAAVFPRKGLGKHDGAGLYLQLDVREVLLGGGLYMPAPDDLNVVRDHIAANHKKFRSIVESCKFQKMFGTLGGEKLSRIPRGFPEGHPAADYLRHRQFLAGRTLDAEIALSPSLLKRIVETFEEMMPLVRFLNEPILKTHLQRVRQEAVLEAPPRL